MIYTQICEHVQAFSVVKRNDNEADPYDMLCSSLQMCLLSCCLSTCQILRQIYTSQVCHGSVRSHNSDFENPV